MNSGRTTGPRAEPTRGRRWIIDLGLGLRLALGGGRGALLRAALVAVGVALGVAALLFAASVPSVQQHREERASAAATGPLSEARDHPVPNTLMMAEVPTSFRENGIWGMLLRPEGARPARPPGVSQLPGPGEMVVSPALAELLREPGSRLLRERLDYRQVGTIADAGTSGPGDLRYYAGSKQLADSGSGSRIDHFGAPPAPVKTPAFLITLIVIGLAVLLLPVGVFIASAVRFGGERRDRRLAALRLGGADRAMLARIASGEALAGTVLGLLLGGALFLAVRQLAGYIRLSDMSVFPVDVQPDPMLTALVVVSVPLLTVTVTLAAMRRVAAEPLGVVRRARGAGRRLWWRLLLPALGVLLLALTDFDAEEVSVYPLAGGALLLLTGVTAVTPWVVERVVDGWRGRGSPSWQLATRRLRLAGDGPTRVVGGITVAVAGAIALQMLFASASDNFTRNTGADPARVRAEISTAVRGDGVAELARLTGKFRHTEGVRQARGMVRYEALPALADPDEVSDFLAVGDCAALAQLSRAGTCRDGDVFLVSGGEPGLEVSAKPGSKLRIGAFGSPEKKRPTWTVSTSAHRVSTRDDGSGTPFNGIWATPRAVAELGLTGGQANIRVRTDSSVPDTDERVRNTAAAISPLVSVNMMQHETVNDTFASISRGLQVGVVAVLVLIGASMLVSTIEQLRDRRRVLAVLDAFGTRRTTLGWSVLWQTALPVLLGLAVATASGLGLGTLLLNLVGQPITVDWPAVLGMVAAGAAVTLAVTVLSLPVLWRLMRPEGLQTE